MTLEDALDIEVLPEQLARLGTGFPEAARRIVELSLAGQTDGLTSLPGYLVLRAGKVKLRLYLGKKQDRVVLFFFKQEGLEDVLLDATVSFSINPLREPEEREELMPDAVRFLVRTPDCFLPEATDQQQADLLTRAGASARNGLLIRFERGAIAVNPETRAIAWPLSDRALKPQDASYVWPLLAISRSLGSWIHDENSIGTERPLDVRALAGSADFQTVQRQLTEAWCRAVNQVERRGPGHPAESASPAQTLTASLTPDFLVSTWRTTLTMRLDGAGNVAFREDENLFQLTAEFEYREEDDGPVAVMNLKPPDFLLSGGVHKALLRALAGDDSVDRIADELAPLLAAPAVTGGPGRGKSDRDIIRDFLESAQARGTASFSALIFRIRRGHRTRKSPDTDVFVLTGQFGGIAPLHLMLKAKVRVTKREASEDSAEEISAEILNDDFGILACSHLPIAGNLGDVTDYFTRLFGHLSRWLRVATT